MFFRVGVTEAIVVTLICALAVAFPSAVVALLSSLVKRIKKIEENLKDKAEHV
ncbi:MAG: hypothetical protein HFACDABA_02399 [Anaerolineales bacterium]|nr:hypothetical protein [Anaerolineales bacterium]